MKKSVFLFVLFTCIALQAQKHDTIQISYNFEKAQTKTIKLLDKLLTDFEVSNDEIITEKYIMDELDVMPIPYLEFKDDIKVYSCSESIEMYIDFTIDYSKLKAFVFSKDTIVGSFEYDETDLLKGEFKFNNLSQELTPTLNKIIYQSYKAKLPIFILADEFLVLMNNKLYVTDNLDDYKIRPINDYFGNVMGEKYVNDLIQYNSILFGEEYHPCKKRKKSKETNIFIKLEKE